MADPTISLAGIFIYPVKSLRGIALSESTLESGSLRYDRRWMLIDEYGQKMTQREHGQMTTLATEITKDGVLVSANGRSPFLIPFDAKQIDFSYVDIWGRACPATFVSAEADGWFSETLKVACRLTVCSEPQPGRVRDGSVRFHDGCAFLVATEPSLADLNRRMEVPIPINRFRPSFVLGGSSPFAEDHWRAITIGGLAFTSVRPCGRCVVTTTDQTTGERLGPDPLRALATFRRGEVEVYFGQYFKSAAPTGTVRVGDEVRIIE